MFTKCLVNLQDVCEPGGSGRLWYWAFEDKDGKVFHRPLTLGAVLDLAADLMPQEWAMLQRAMKEPGTWVGN
jgi:hypothetical protein